MKGIIQLISLLFIYHTAYNQEHFVSKSYESFKDADSIVKKTLELNYQNIETINFTLEGNLFYQGHYSVPRKRRASENIINISAFNNSVYLQTDSILYDDNYIVKSEYFSKDSSFITNFKGEVITKGSEAKTQSKVMIYSPVTLLWDLLENKSSLRYLGVDKETNSHVISYMSSSNKQISLLINLNTYLVERAEILRYSAIRGDYLLQYCFSEYKSTLNNLKCPQKLVIKEWGETLQDFRYNYNNIELKNEPVNEPHFSLQEIDENLYRIIFPSMKHSSYLVDFGEYLGVVETPIDNNQMHLLADYICKHFPNKPIKYAFLTHHHPDHAGGFAYFYKNGGTIVTTDLSSIYQKELLEGSHLLQENNNIKSTCSGEFEIVQKNGRKKYATKNATMCAIEFADNGHTKEFILYYFPKSKVLIVGDYFYMTQEIRPSHRAAILDKFITESKVKVERIYPTWAPATMKKYCTLKDLKESARLYKKKIKTGSNN